MNDKNDIKENFQRPAQLTLLCILSFVAGGFSILGNLYFYAFQDQIVTLVESGFFQQFLDGSVTLDFLRDVSPNFFLLQLLANATSVFGVLLMWKLNSTGFHIYAISQIILILIPEVYLPGIPFPIMDILLSLVFILLYFKNLKSIGRI